MNDDEQEELDMSREEMLALWSDGTAADVSRFVIRSGTSITVDVHGSFLGDVAPPTYVVELSA